MQQETNDALNELANDVSSDFEIIEHLNSTNFQLSVLIRTLEWLIFALQVQM